MKRSLQILGLLALSAGIPAVHAAGDLVFSTTNEPEHNSLAVYTRSPEGALGDLRLIDSGGRGSLDKGRLILFLNGSSNSVITDTAKQLVFMVSAGSNEVSSYAISGQNVSLVGTVLSGGIRPVSLAVRGDRLYVLNAGVEGADSNIATFRIGEDGQLSPVRGGIRALAAGARNPTQIEFAPDKPILIEVDTLASTLSSFIADADGRLSAPHVQASIGGNPAGFGFTSQGVLVVSEENRGAKDAGTLSSYRLDGAGNLSVVTAMAPALGTGSCWIAFSADDRYVYTTNTLSDTITRFAIDRDGALATLPGGGLTQVTGGSEFLTLDMTRVEDVLYVHDGPTGTIHPFRIQTDGDLVPIPSSGAGLPPYSVGVSAN